MFRHRYKLDCMEHIWKCCETLCCSRDYRSCVVDVFESSVVSVITLHASMLLLLQRPARVHPPARALQQHSIESRRVDRMEFLLGKSVSWVKEPPDICISIHTGNNTYTQTYIHSFIHSFIYSFIHTYIHTYMYRISVAELSRLPHHAVVKLVRTTTARLKTAYGHVLCSTTDQSRNY